MGNVVPIGPGQEWRGPGWYPPGQPIWIDPRYAHVPQWPATWSGVTTTATGVQWFDTWREAIAFAVGVKSAGSKPRVRREVTPFATKWAVRWRPFYVSYNQEK